MTFEDEVQAEYERLRLDPEARQFGGLYADARENVLRRHTREARANGLRAAFVKAVKRLRHIGRDLA